MRAAVVSCVLCALGCVDPDQFATPTDAGVEGGTTRDGPPPPADRGVSLDGPADAATADAMDAAVPTDARDTDGATLPDAERRDGPAPACEVTFSVTLPAETPEATIHVAGTFHDDEVRDWNPGDPQLAMSRDGDMATLTLRLPDGRALDYKYTRGDWDRSEVTVDCQELTNRTTVVACVDGRFGVDDVVVAWRDLCQ